MGEGCRQSHDSCCVLIRLGKAWKAQIVAEGISVPHRAGGLGSVPWAPLLYLHCKDVSIGGWAVRATQQEIVALSCHVFLHMCACMCARLSEKRQLHFYCLPPLPPPPSVQWWCRRLSVLRLCHSLQTYFPGRAVMQKTQEKNIYFCMWKRCFRLDKDKWDLYVPTYRWRL